MLIFKNKDLENNFSELIKLYTCSKYEINEKDKEIERLNNIINEINKILKDDDLCHIEKLQEIYKLVGSDKE